jgi:hypothetical protein
MQISLTLLVVLVTTKIPRQKGTITGSKRSSTTRRDGSIRSTASKVAVMHGKRLS